MLQKSKSMYAHRMRDFVAGAGGWGWLLCALAVWSQRFGCLHVDVVRATSLVLSKVSRH